MTDGTGLDAMLDELRATQGRRCRRETARLNAGVALLVILGLACLGWALVAGLGVEVARMVPTT